MFKTILMVIILIPFSLFAQTEAEYTSAVNKSGMSEAQFTSLIDIPSAGVLYKGDYDFELRLFPQGGVLMGFGVGLFDRFNMGVSYGGTQIIGDSAKIKWNDEPGVNVKYRLFNEGSFFPAIALGYSSQGYGPYLKNDSTDTKRYLIKSKGLYGVASKNFKYAGKYDIGTHLGVNFNSNEQDDDQGMNMFFGVDFAMNEDLALVAEYDFAWNDQGGKSFGEGKGYLNSALRWTFADNLLFQFDFRDLLGNNRDSETVAREIKIVYRQAI